MTNSNTHSQAEAWERGQSLVGRVALIPTLIYLLKQLIVQWKYLCQSFKIIEHLFYACLRRDEGNPTYELFKNQKHYNLPHFSHKLFFNVKISLFKKWSII
jgi:hypothetical protein